MPYVANFDGVAEMDDGNSLFYSTINSLVDFDVA